MQLQLPSCYSAVCGDQLYKLEELHRPWWWTPARTVRLALTATSRRQPLETSRATSAQWEPSNLLQVRWIVFPVRQGITPIQRGTVTAIFALLDYTQTKQELRTALFVTLDTISLSLGRRSVCSAAWATTQQRGDSQNVVNVEKGCL